MKIDGSGSQIGGRLEDIYDVFLCETLCTFVVEVRNQRGGFYPRETLYSLMIMIQMYLSTKGWTVRFLQENQFVKLKNMLDNQMKDLSKQGYITPKNKAEVITLSQENAMWNQGILGDTSPHTLLYSLMYLLGLQFALWAGEEHKSLKFGKQLFLDVDAESGSECLVYIEHTAKNNQGGLSAMKQTGKKLKAYPNLDNPSCCLIQMFKKYVAARLTSPKCSQDFYLRPLAKFKMDGVGFSCQPLGIHKIETAIKDLCKQAGLSGHHSNHSLRATSASHLYEAGVDEQLIQEHTGHRSNAVRGYKRTSSKLQQQVTQTLYGPPKKFAPSATVSVAPNSQAASSEQPEDRHVDVHVPTSVPSSTLLCDTDEGKALKEGLEKANISLSDAMCSRVCDLPSGLFSTICSFMNKFARKQQPNVPSADGVNINLHVHFHWIIVFFVCMLLCTFVLCSVHKVWPSSKSLLCPLFHLFALRSVRKVCPQTRWKTRS